MMDFIHEKATEKDIDLLFGPDPEPFERFSNGFLMEHLVIRLGIFKSLTQARKNGWSGEIPPGFRKWKIGKKVFFTYIPMELNDETDFY